MNILMSIPEAESIGARLGGLRESNAWLDLYAQPIDGNEVLLTGGVYPMGFSLSIPVDIAERLAIQIVQAAHLARKLNAAASAAVAVQREATQGELA